MASKKSAATTKTAAKRTSSTKKGASAVKKRAGSARKPVRKRTGSKKRSTQKTLKGAARKVAAVMHEWKEGTLRSGGSGKRVTSQKQAVAIGLSEARKAGAKVPKKKTARKGKAS